MTTTSHHTPNTEQFEDCDSGFISSQEHETALDLGELFSHKFTNITPIYKSNNGATEIYTATRYGKKFILKGLKEQYRDDPVYLMGLMKEFEIGIVLDHPNIRSTIGVETDENLGRVIVLEYIDGQTLEQLLISGFITPNLADRIIHQVADALSYIHNKQVYHRDLKPANILISYHGNQAKIIDFNLSDSDDFIVLKNPAGTLKYMAPEQQTLGAHPSAAADIFSFGKILREIAQAIGSQKLENLATILSQTDAEKRPQTIGEIQFPNLEEDHASVITQILDSKYTTYTLIASALGLLGFLTTLLTT